jgi:hypothetical protein
VGSNWATRNCPTSWALGTTRFSTRDGREMPARFSLPSLPLRENGEPRVARTSINSFRLKQFARRKRSGEHKMVLESGKNASPNKDGRCRETN